MNTIMKTEPELKGKTQSPSVSSLTEAVLEERIRGRAFEIYTARAANGAPGDAVSDWLQAEREINGGRRSETPGRQAGSREVKPTSRSQARGETLMHSGD